MADARRLMGAMEAEVALGSLSGVPPSEIWRAVLVTLDRDGMLHVAAPGLGDSPAETGIAAALLEDAARQLRERESDG